MIQSFKAVIKVSSSLLHREVPRLTFGALLSTVLIILFDYNIFRTGNNTVRRKINRVTESVIELELRAVFEDSNNLLCSKTQFLFSLEMS